MTPDIRFGRYRAKDIPIRATAKRKKQYNRFLIRLREIYVRAGVEFVSVKEGGAGNISPKALKKVLLPHLEALFSETPVPQAVSLPGKADRAVEPILRCGPDAVVVDQACDIGKIRTLVPEQIPLFRVCGP